MHGLNATFNSSSASDILGGSWTLTSSASEIYSGILLTTLSLQSTNNSLLSIRVTAYKNSNTAKTNYTQAPYGFSTDYYHTVSLTNFTLNGNAAFYTIIQNNYGSSNWTRFGTLTNNTLVTIDANGFKTPLTNQQMILIEGNVIATRLNYSVMSANKYTQYGTLKVQFWLLSGGCGTTIPNSPGNCGTTLTKINNHTFNTSFDMYQPNGFVHIQNLSSSIRLPAGSYLIDRLSCTNGCAYGVIKIAPNSTTIMNITINRVAV